MVVVDAEEIDSEFGKPFLEFMTLFSSIMAINNCDIDKLESYICPLVLNYENMKSKA